MKDLKHSNNSIFLCFLILLNLIGSVGVAGSFDLRQDSLAAEASQDRFFDDRAMADYREQQVFDYSKEMVAVPSWMGLLAYTILDWLGQFLNTSNGDIISKTLFRILLIVVIVLGVMLIIRIRYGGMVARSRVYDNAPLGTVAVEDHDYRSMLQQAIENGNRKLAVRYLYLNTLKELHQKGVIKVVKWKTAMDYQQELSDDFRPTFNQLAALFENSWYGDHEPSIADFEAGIDLSKQLVL